MADPFTRVYRGDTRDYAERWYHQDARTLAGQGYAPSAEEWSMALGQHVLTVRYIHEPDQASVVLSALDGAERGAGAPVVSMSVAERTPTTSGQGAVRGNSFRTGLIVLIVVFGAIALSQSRSPGSGGGGGGGTAPIVGATRAPATPASQFTISQQNAIDKAGSYLDFTAFSRKGLIQQLEFEGFSKADATFAVDHITVDWNDQAWKKAKEYLDFSSFSRKGLIEQLEYEGFTNAQATYGVNKVGL